MPNGRARTSGTGSRGGVFGWADRDGLPGQNLVAGLLGGAVGLCPQAHSEVVHVSYVVVLSEVGLVTASRGPVRGLTEDSARLGSAGQRSEACSPRAPHTTARPRPPPSAPASPAPPGARLCADRRTAGSPARQPRIGNQLPEGRSPRPRKCGPERTDSGQPRAWGFAWDDAAARKTVIAARAKTRRWGRVEPEVAIPGVAETWKRSRAHRPEVLDSPTQGMDLLCAAHHERKQQCPAPTRLAATASALLPARPPNGASCPPRRSS